MAKAGQAYGPGEMVPGRDEAIRTLADMMVSEPVTVLFGISGVGKTSLLSGIPREFQMQNAVFLVCDLANVGSDKVVDEIRIKIEGKLGAADPTAVSLFDLLSGAFTKKYSVFVIFDHMERLLADGGCDSLLKDLAHCFRREDTCSSFLLSVREENLGLLESLRKYYPPIFRGLYRLSEFSADEAAAIARKEEEERRGSQETAPSHSDWKIFFEECLKEDGKSGLNAFELRVVLDYFARPDLSETPFTSKYLAQMKPEFPFNYFNSTDPVGSILNKSLDIALAMDEVCLNGDYELNIFSIDDLLKERPATPLDEIKKVLKELHQSGFLVDLASLPGRFRVAHRLLALNLREVLKEERAKRQGEIGETRDQRVVRRWHDFRHLWLLDRANRTHDSTIRVQLARRAAFEARSVDDGIALDACLLLLTTSLGWAGELDDVYVESWKRVPGDLAPAALAELLLEDQYDSTPAILARNVELPTGSDLAY